MKLIFLTTSILLLFTPLVAQPQFAFNSAIQESDQPQVQFASHNSTTTIKSLLNTGPYAVNHDLVNQRLDIAMSNVFDVLLYELQDMNGHKVTAPTVKDGFKIQVQLDQLPRGLYVLKLKSAHETFATKIQHGI